MKPQILLQLDTDSPASSFDAIVAIDAGVERLISYSGVTEDQVERLIHGCIFTRGPKDLHNTAIFVGGSQVAAGERIVARARSTFFGAMSVSILLDCNGCNSTAAAAVLHAMRHVDLPNQLAIVFGATGPVGRRVTALLARRETKVVAVSRDHDRVAQMCNELVQSEGIHPELLHPRSLSDLQDIGDLINPSVVVGCGAAGVELLPESKLAEWKSVRVAIDLNAVAPSGIGGIQIQDYGTERDGRFDYGAIGVGGLKMKIHKAAIQKLFEKNDLFLDAEQLMEIGQAVLIKEGIA